MLKRYKLNVTLSDERQINAGQIEFSVPDGVGDWVSGNSYVVGNIVSYAGGSYMCTNAIAPSTESPVLDTDHWQQIAEKGDVGPRGAQGTQGEKGDTGEQGPQGVQGEKGDTGERGPQGVQGPQGASGVTGVTSGTPTQSDGYTVTPLTFNFEHGNSKTVNVSAQNGASASLVDLGDVALADDNTGTVSITSEQMTSFLSDFPPTVGITIDGLFINLSRVGVKRGPGATAIFSGVMVLNGVISITTLQARGTSGTVTYYILQTA